MPGPVSRLIKELETDPEEHSIGKGWLSGVLGIVLASAGAITILMLSFPGLFSTPIIKKSVNADSIQLAAQLVLLTGFVFAVISLILRQSKTLGLIATVIVIAGAILGMTMSHIELATSKFSLVSLDWFILNLLFLGIIFLPLERLFYRKTQKVFRAEWREDLFYFFISSLLVQVLTLFSMLPSKFLLSVLPIGDLQKWIGNQNFFLQLIAVMFLTDFIQYWLHRAFHKVPWLWRFHAVHHSAKTMDWLAGSRMHFMEIIILRGVTVIPMFVLGFSIEVIYSYLVLVYLYSTYIHANVRFDIEWLKPVIVTPRFHHWHHGLEKEAVDVNFAIHFPIFDRLFGTYHMPKNRWPEGYGVGGHPVPGGFIKQFLYPFSRPKK